MGIFKAISFFILGVITASTLILFNGSTHDRNAILTLVIEQHPIETNENNVSLIEAERIAVFSSLHNVCEQVDSNVNFSCFQISHKAR